MFMNAGDAATASGLGRRALLALLPMAALAITHPAFAETAPSGPAATIGRFDGALLATMKSAGRTDFSQRFQALSPAVDQAFDLPAILSTSVGPTWASLSPDEQNRLLGAFRRYTVASYVSNFNSYSGQTFTVSPDTRTVGEGRVVVQSHITPVDGDATELDYVMQQTPSGWKAVDVLAAGSISRVAVQRSDFRHLLSHGGGGALLSSLQRKTSDLSDGAIA